MIDSLAFYLRSVWRHQITSGALAFLRRSSEYRSAKFIRIALTLVGPIKQALDDVVYVHVRRRLLCFRDYLFEHAVHFVQLVGAIWAQCHLKSPRTQCSVAYHTPIWAAPALHVFSGSHRFMCIYIAASADWLDILAKRAPWPSTDYISPGSC